MVIDLIYEFDFEKTWKNVRVMHKEGYFTSASDLHTHPFYEINLILDGNFNILDLVRAKKYVAGASVTVNMRFIENDLGNAQLLVSLRQALLKGDKK